MMGVSTAKLTLATRKMPLMVGSSIAKTGPSAGRMGFKYPWVTPLSDSITAIATIMPMMVLRVMAAVAGGAVLFVMCFLGIRGDYAWVMRVTTLGPASIHCSVNCSKSTNPPWNLK